MCPTRTKRESGPHTTPFRGIVSSFSQWVHLTLGCISVSSRGFPQGLRLREGTSFFPLRLGSVFRCSVLEVRPLVECGWPFFRSHAQGDSQASEDRTCGSRTYKPNSVCRIAPAGRSFLWATHCCGAQATYPKVVTRRAGTYPEPKSRTPSLFGLAPCGVCPARPITATAVRSYRTFSPLPRRRRPGGIFSVVLSVDWA